MTRPFLRSLLVLVVAVAAALVGWRVLKPTELVITSDGPIEAAWIRGPVVVGASNVAPLFVDGRYRVFASQRELRSDGRADGFWVATAKWSLRRWPQQLSGVVSVGATVVSRWSDGELIGQDATDGRVVWRAKGPSAPGYTGYRVGAQTVWDPAGLHTSGNHVVVSDGRVLATYDSATGAAGPQVRLPAGCDDGHVPHGGFLPAGGFTTAGGAYVCGDGAWEVATGAPVANWPAGPSEPLGCDAAASGCRGLRDAAGHGWLTGTAAPTRTAPLDAAGSTVVSGRIYTAAGALADPASGLVLDRYPGMLVLGASGRRIVLLDQARYLVEVDRDNGSMIDRRPLAHGTDSLLWNPGLFQLSGNLVAVERLHLDGPADPGKPDHYFATDAVITAALG